MWSLKSLKTVLIVLACVAVFLSLGAPLDSKRQVEEAQKSLAHLGSKAVVAAIQEYVGSPQNEKQELPRILNDLVQPPFGGPSFLKNGSEDLIDPWGQPYQMERRQRPDGEAYILVWTTAPDGTKISQFGVGRNAEPEWPDEKPK